jgi:hypothetical protein
MGVREKMVDLCQTYLPRSDNVNALSHWNQIGFDNIAKDYGKGSGTSCGSLPSWLLWRLGCADASIMNRSVPDLGIKYRSGESISTFSSSHPSRVVVDGKLATKMANEQGGAQPGDFIVIRGGFWLNPVTKVRDRDSSHIFVLLKVLKTDGKEVQWLVGQCGVTNNADEQCGQIKVLTGKLRQEPVKEGNAEIAGPHLVFIANIMGEETDFPRRVKSYTNVDAITFGAQPNGAFTQIFDSRCKEATRNDPERIYPFLGWFEESNPGGFIMSSNYIVLERGHEATRFTRRGLGTAYSLDTNGAWTRMGDRLEIQWREGRRQSWDVKKVWSPKEATTGTPVDGNGGTLAMLKEMPDEVPAKWAGTHFIDGVGHKAK